jgi:hypothetical protein
MLWIYDRPALIAKLEWRAYAHGTVGMFEQRIRRAQTHRFGTPVAGARVSASNEKRRNDDANGDADRNTIT